MYVKSLNADDFGGVGYESVERVGGEMRVA